jgi:acyl-homoserine lactone synthase
MAHIIGADPSVSEAIVLRGMFSARKRVFVDLLRWDVPVLDGRFEIDQFDGPEAMYLIITDRDGDHRGSLRLLSTSGPTILGDLFPFLCDKGPPASPSIWEISRLCLSPDLRARDRRVVRDQLATALVNFALANAIESYCCVADAAWLSQILSFGWDCMPLGLPQRLECGLTGALRIDVDAQTPARMAAAGTWRSDPLRRIVPAHAYSS